MKTIISVLFVFLLHTVSATPYYFSSTSGDDSRTATQAQNPSTPWKSIAKLNSFFASLQPGDNIFFKRGETFYGTISITKSGTSASPIVIGAYGSGNKPIITSLVTLSGWTANPNYPGVYESSANTAFGTSVSILLLNNVQKATGRYPNATAANGGYLTLDSHSGLNSITDNELPSSPNWNGAEVVIRTNHWTIDRSLITSHSGHTIDYKNSTFIAARDGYGYFIQNDIKTLDVLGEWYFNPATKKISVFFGSAGPGGYTTQAATNDNVISSSKASYVVLDNLQIKGSNLETININNGSNMVVQNCDVSFAGTDGVVASGTNFKIENCTITNSNNDGIDVSTGNNSIVRNNTVTNSYTMAGMGLSGNGQGSGIRNCAGGLIEYNRVINTGYIGIQVGGDNAKIKNNYIDNFGYVKDDGGGIYTSNGLNKTNKGRVISGNIIMNGIGAPLGTDSDKSSMQGIYMDDNTNGVEIIGNTVSNCNLGIQLHNSRNVVVSENTLYNNLSSQLYMKHDNLGDPLTGHTITNNIFFSKYLSQLASSVTSIANDLANIGKLDSNYYARPIDDGTTIYTAYTNSGGAQTSGIYDLNGWKSLYNFDNKSKSSAKQIEPYTVTSTNGANKYVDGSFNTSTTKNNVWANSCSLSWANSGMLDGGYLKVVPSATGSSIVVSVGALSTSKKYVLKFSVKGAGMASIAANLRAASYQPITQLKYWAIGTARSDNEMLFTPLANESNGSLVFTLDAKQTYYIDNIQLLEAVATPTNPDDSLHFLINPSTSDKTISLSGNYVDVKNNKYSNSIVLKPYTSAVLIRDGGVSNVSPTVSITAPGDSAKFIADANITISADAADKDGSVSKVEFYNGKTLLGSDNSKPYSFTWNKVAQGSYSITAEATDNSGATTISSVVNIIVNAANVSPQITLTSPVSKTSFQSPASIMLSADASDSDGMIESVEFYNGATLLATEKTIPYTWSWTNVAPGTYSITAKAKDNSGATTTTPAVDVVVASPNNSPSVNISSPSNNSSFIAPAGITINASATDSDGSISKVEFYNGSTLLGSDNSSPYSYSWNNIAAGKYTLTVKATDNSGASTTSSSVTVVVGTPNASPVVSINSPSNNASFIAPANVTIDASASDADGTITKVEFFDGNTLIGSDNSSPYSYKWNNVAAGKYTLTAKATDNLGASTTSSAVMIVVGLPNVPPVVNITTPSTNTTFTTPANVRIDATASDPDGSVSKVEFYNGGTLIGVDNSSPYSFIWSNVPAGTHTITAWATDNSGASVSSTSVEVIVGTPNAAPIVNITSPTSKANYPGPASVILSADASDSDGTITKVEFFAGANLIVTEKVAPYYWTWKNVQPGTYIITAKATDNNGAVTISAPVTLVVGTPNIPPVVDLTSPVANDNYQGPASVILSATASDTDGSISKVEFYNGANLITTEKVSPYYWTWKNVQPGKYIITAKAIDNKGASTISSPVTLLVETPNIAPVVNLTSPVANANYQGPASVILSADASDSDGSITKVEFYDGTKLIVTEKVAPYYWTWKNVQPGNYTITAKATDNKGRSTTSSQTVMVVKSLNAAPTVSIFSPVSNVSFAGPANITIDAIAGDADGSVSKVELFEGTTLIGSLDSSPYSFTWSNVAAGSHTVTAVATDNSGSSSTSAPVVINVAVAQNAAPTVTIINPLTDANFIAPSGITIDAAAADSDGTISKVEFYEGNTLIGSTDSNPYSFNWNNVSAGTYVLTAKAIDNAGNSSVSIPVTVSVIALNAAPAVNITSPVTHANFTAPATITIDATAIAADGSIDKVEFYDGSNLIGTATSAPFRINWDKAPVGTRIITARAMDNNGATGSSSSISIEVSPIIAFLQFTGDPSSKNVELKWTTNSPGNKSMFKVQRGARSYTFKEIGTLPSLGGNGSTTDYSFVDSTPITGRNYYRVVCVDSLGNLVNSSVIFVNSNNKSFFIDATMSNRMSDRTSKTADDVNVTVGPNPASNFITVYFNTIASGKNMSLDIVSLDGILMKSIQANSSDTKADIDISSLRAGSYFLRIVLSDRIITKKFVKQ